jgi:hypothetical protein
MSFGKSGRQTRNCQCFALNGTVHKSHTEQDAAIGAYIRWRNQHANPKTNFAPKSRIREPGYAIKAA